MKSTAANTKSNSGPGPTESRNILHIPDTSPPESGWKFVSESGAELRSNFGGQLGRMASGVFYLKYRDTPKVYEVRYNVLDSETVQKGIDISARTLRALIPGRVYRGDAGTIAGPESFNGTIEFRSAAVTGAGFGSSFVLIAFGSGYTPVTSSLMAFGILAGAAAQVQGAAVAVLSGRCHIKELTL